MNRRAFVRHLVSYGCCVEREGKRHTLYARREASGFMLFSAVPRHTELARGTVRAICGDLKIPTPF